METMGLVVLRGFAACRDGQRVASAAYGDFIPQPWLEGISAGLWRIIRQHDLCAAMEKPRKHLLK